MPRIRTTLAKDSGTYQPAFVVPAPTGVGVTDQAAILAAYNKAVAAGGGRVVLQSTVSGGLAVPYQLTASLPVSSGVAYEGIRPAIQQIITAQGSGWLADGEWNYIGGTVLKGDGTFPAFAGNNTDQGSPSANLGLTELHDIGLWNIGFDNFTHGFSFGALNIMGPTFSRIGNLWFKNCSTWGASLINFAHCEIGNMYACLCQNGYYFASKMDGTVFQPGNTLIGELYNLVPRDGRDSRLCRGIVFDVTGNGSTAGQLNLVNTYRLQVNRFGTALLSVTAGFTNISTTVTVPDGTKFAVGMPVLFTTTNYGVTANQMYIVLSVSGNNLTIGNSRTSSAITATGTGNLTLQSYGFPNVEVVASNAASRCQGMNINSIDSEGVATAALYVENAGTCNFGLMITPVTTLTDLVARNALYCRFDSRPVVKTDFDPNSSGSEFYGQRSSTIQYPTRGLWRDTTLGTNVLSIGNGLNANSGGDLQIRAQGFTYPTIGMGERIFTRDTSLTLQGYQGAGDVVFAGAAGQTFTLPTIVTDTAPANSHIGLYFNILNVSGNTLTVATDGTQLFNKVGAKVSLSVATQTGLKVVACKDNSGNLFWAAWAYSLA